MYEQTVHHTDYEQASTACRTAIEASGARRAWASASTTCGRCATSTSTSPPARCSACSATTAPARPPPSASSPRCRHRPRAGPRRRLRRRPPARRRPPPHRRRLPAGHRRRAAQRPAQPRDGRAPAPAAQGRGQRRADELLERLDLTDAADRLVKTFSGGMRRRLDLAASLVAAPEVLFLDEPTTGLDPRSRGDLWDLLRELVRDGHDRHPHHAVPRGGRPPGRRHRRARPRPDRRRTAPRPSSRRRIGDDRIEVTVRRGRRARPAAAARSARSSPPSRRSTAAC